MTIPVAGTYRLDQAHNWIVVPARHMMVSPVRGEFSEATAEISVAEDPLLSGVTATIQTASITTGSEDRDTPPQECRLSRRRALSDAAVSQARQIEWKSTEGPILTGRVCETTVSVGEDEVSPATGRHNPGRFVLSGELTVKGITRAVDLQVNFGGARRDPYGQSIFGFSERRN